MDFSPLGRVSNVGCGSKRVSVDDLDARILQAHDDYDPYLLSELYAQASQLKRAGGDEAAAGFLLTQAYVFALESGHPSVGELRSLLVQDGRELSE